MKVFITSIKAKNGNLWEGPKIEAKSFEEAEAKTKGLGVILDGQLSYECVSY